VSLILEDERFLQNVFVELRETKTSELRRKELILFLKEFCQFSQTLQPPSREVFYKSLSSLGILPGLEITLQSSVKETKAASVDILMFIVEYSPSLVREYMMQQITNTEDDGLLMNIIIEGMICDTEMGASVQLMNIIRTLLDPENMLASVNKSEKTDFLNHFYKHCMHVFVNPLLSNTVHEQPEKSDSSTVQVLGLIVELLSFFVEHHTYHIKNYILHKDLLRRILVLLKSRHTFLKLSALRFMRKIITLKDEFYNRYITRGNLFAPVIDSLISNYDRYNLLNSAILEMFEFIKLEDIKSLCNHVVEKYGPTLDKITYVKTFAALKLRYEQHQDRLKERSSIEPCTSILRNPVNRFRKDDRAIDEDEEMWFNDDDEDMDEPASLEPTDSGATSMEVVSGEPQQLPQQTATAAAQLITANVVVAGDTAVTAVNQPTSIDKVMEEDKIKELGGGAGVNNGTSLNLVTLPNQDNDTTNGLKTAAVFGGLNGGTPAVIEGNNGTNNGENGDAAVAASPVVAAAAGAEKIAVLGPLVDYDSDSEEESGSDDR